MRPSTVTPAPARNRAARCCHLRGRTANAPDRSSPFLHVFYLFSRNVTWKHFPRYRRDHFQGLGAPRFFSRGLLDARVDFLVVESGRGQHRVRADEKGTVEPTRGRLLLCAPLKKWQDFGKFFGARRSSVSLVLDWTGVLEPVTPSGRCNAFLSFSFYTT